MRKLAATLAVMTAMNAWASGGTELKRYQDVVQSAPQQQARNLKVWSIKQNEMIRINLVEISGELPLHLHPDAAHSVMVVEGRLRVQVGEARLDLSKGDFVSIPKNTPHKYWSLGPKAMMISMDSPYYDPKKTILLE